MVESIATKSPERKPLRIYLAGKIAKEDWRRDLVDGLRWATKDDGGWPNELVGAVCGHDYVGPFFDDCCGHNCNYRRDSHGCSLDGSWCSSTERMRHDVVASCFWGINFCDMVLAWMGEPECDGESTAYGTLVEIGYALGNGKRVFIAGAKPGSLWFAHAACERIDAASPGEALDAAIRAMSCAPVLDACESPIEVALAEAMLKSPLLCDKIAAQYEVDCDGKKYRLDFAIVTDCARIAIECDGHDFHERTKEQAAHDRSRDRALTLAGWTVLRFTGSEIHRSAKGCVGDVEKAVGW